MQPASAERFLAHGAPVSPGHSCASILSMGEEEVLYVDISRVQHLLSWQAAVSLREDLANAVAHLDERLREEPALA